MSANAWRARKHGAYSAEARARKAARKAARKIRRAAAHANVRSDRG